MCKLRTKYLISLYNATCDLTTPDLNGVAAPAIRLVLSEPHWIDIKIDLHV